MVPDFFLWLPLRMPELILGALIAGTGAAASTLFGVSRFFGLMLIGIGAFLVKYLRPRKHPMEGYGVLMASDKVPKLTEQGSIRIAGDRFVDEHGRTLLLHGINLSG